MLQEDVLCLLRESDSPLSGEEMSRRLGVSRAAVWKAVTALRKSGYVVNAQPSKGYQLLDSPDLLSPGELERPTRIVGSQVLCLSCVDSTNDECKRQAMAHAPDGLAITAEEQNRGKGRRGRSFQSLPGQGLYLSVLLRPRVTPEEVSRITAWTAVAVCRAVNAATGLTPDIKWPNDVLLEGKKLCGILTEMGLVAESGELDYVVVGMGVNVRQTEADFGPELSPVATSLSQHGANVRRAVLARALLDELNEMYLAFPAKKETYLEEYRRRCVTVGREVQLIHPDHSETGVAIDVEDDFTLRVRLADGSEKSVSSGEVTVRGLLGYT